MMTPIPIQSPGVQGWLLAKENARLLLSDLTARTIKQGLSLLGIGVVEKM